MSFWYELEYLFLLPQISITGSLITRVERFLSLRHLQGDHQSHPWLWRAVPRIFLLWAGEWETVQDQQQQHSLHYTPPITNYMVLIPLCLQIHDSIQGDMDLPLKCCSNSAVLAWRGKEAPSPQIAPFGPPCLLSTPTKTIFGVFLQLFSSHRIIQFALKWSSR